MYKKIFVIFAACILLIPNAVMPPAYSHEYSSESPSLITTKPAAFTFFIAKVLNDYHPNVKDDLNTVIWSIAALIPASTGYLRIQAGKHFPSDVIAGYIVGASVGFLIPHLHMLKKDKLRNLSLAPTLYGDHGGIRLSYKF